MDIVLRAAFTFVFLLFLTRVVGKRELSTFEPFDVILLVVLGDLIAQGVMQSDYSLTGMMLAAGTMSLMTVLASYLSYRVRSLRPVLDGEPIVLLQDGKPLDRNLRRERITLEELAAEARMQSIETLEEVKWAVLETNGQISFVKNQ
ncbi:MAG TPA: YetF domain-containing protein [Gaiellaceae bacterium]|nr:YetF domain-containing protein [Gaiellaceae bacterium]